MMGSVVAVACAGVGVMFVGAALVAGASLGLALVVGGAATAIVCVVVGS